MVWNMRLIHGKQKNVLFIWCSSPINIDKSSEWGPNNHQFAPNGAFLKVNEGEEGEQLSVSHLVQPNESGSAPLGWFETSPNRYDKCPIWVEDEALPIGEVKTITTADGVINYEVKEESYVCYNNTASGADIADSWIQTADNLRKNYEF